MNTIVSVLNGTYVPQPQRWESDEEREKYYEDADKQTEWFSKATLDDLNSRTDEEWNELIEMETGFVDLFYNKNVGLMEEEKLIHILEIMKARKQRFHDDIYYCILLFPFSVREWAVKNLAPITNNELYIEDKENF